MKRRIESGWHVPSPQSTPRPCVGGLRTAAIVLVTVGAAAFLAADLLRAQEVSESTLEPAAGSASAETHFDVYPESVLPATGFVISPDDTLEIYALDVAEISREYRVEPTGSIAIPLIPDPVHAAGLTPGELAEEIGEKLQKAGMVTHPRVSVQVKSSRTHTIAIAGAVKKPQIYPVFTHTTLLDAISQAEGLASDAGNTATITRGGTSTNLERQGGSGDTASPPSPGVQVIDLRRLLEQGDPALNVDLFPGDRVTVQRAGIVYVVGAVNRAGGFVLNNDREQMTVLKAVALAENLKSTAVGKKATIIRKDTQASAPDREIPVNLDRVLDGKAPDQTLLANDILFVPDGAAKKALHRAGEAAAQAASLFVYRLP